MMGKPLVPEVPAYLQRYSDFFAELVCQQADFQHYLPTLSAAAIIVATRRAVNLLPNWTPELQGVLGYTAEQVQGPFLHLWLHYADAFPQQTAVTDAQFKDTVAAAVQTYRGVPPMDAVLHLQSQQAAAKASEQASAALAAASNAHAATPDAKLSMSQRSEASTVTPGGAYTPGAGRGFAHMESGSAGPSLQALTPSFAASERVDTSNPYLSSARVGATTSSTGADPRGLQSRRPALGSQPVNVPQVNAGAHTKVFSQGAVPANAGLRIGVPSQTGVY